MKFLPVFVAIVLLSANLRADDTVYKAGSKETVRGRIAAMSATEVTVEKGTESETIKIVDIDYIKFDGEPGTLNTVRNNLDEGRFDNALKALERIEKTAIERPELDAEIQYLLAQVNAQAALGRGDPEAIRAAGKGMLEFCNKNASHFRFYAATETLGDLYVAVGDFSKAKGAYEKLAASDFSEIQLRGAVAVGKALFAEEKYTEALAAYDKVLALAQSSQNELAKSRRFAAMLGKARCLERAGKGAEGLALAQEVLAAIPAENKDLHADAWLAIGACYREQPDGRKPAIWAYLHVDLVYNQNGAAHAEALYYLANLWNLDGQSDRSAQARELLAERYAASSWAKR